MGTSMVSYRFSLALTDLADLALAAMAQLRSVAVLFRASAGCWVPWTSTSSLHRAGDLELEFIGNWEFVWFGFYDNSIYIDIYIYIYIFTDISYAYIYIYVYNICNTWWFVLFLFFVLENKWYIPYLGYFVVWISFVYTPWPCRFVLFKSECKVKFGNAWYSRSALSLELPGRKRQNCFTSAKSCSSTSIMFTY